MCISHFWWLPSLRLRRIACSPVIRRNAVDKAFVQMISEEQTRIGHSLPIYSLMILNALKSLNRASVNELAEFIHTNENRIRPIVESLLESGMVEASGTGRGRT